MFFGFLILFAPQGKQRPHGSTFYYIQLCITLKRSGLHLLSKISDDSAFPFNYKSSFFSYASYLLSRSTFRYLVIVCLIRPFHPPNDEFNLQLKKPRICKYFYINFSDTPTKLAEGVNEAEERCSYNSVRLLLADQQVGILFPNACENNLRLLSDILNWQRIIK